MQFSKRILWCLVNGTGHDKLEKEDQTISAIMPLIEALFPGMNYYSITGAGEVYTRCLAPAARKLYPGLATVSLESIAPDTMMEVTEVLPSDGYEWQDDPEWMTRFQEILESRAA